MERRIMLALLALAALALTACGGSSDTRNADTTKGYTVNARSDTPLAADRCRMRFFVEGTELSEAEWTVDGQTYTSSEADGSVFLDFNHPGSVNASFRGVDKDGKDCTGPRGGVKFSARKGANSDPVLIVDGPFSGDDGTITDPDGTSYRYHQWRWSSARSYDPDFDTPYTSFDWEIWSTDSTGKPLALVASMTDGVPHNGDLDGDGRDDVTVDPDPDTSHFMVTVNFKTIRESPTIFIFKTKPKPTIKSQDLHGTVSLLK